MPPAPLIQATSEPSPAIDGSTAYLVSTDVEDRRAGADVARVDAVVVGAGREVLGVGGEGHERARVRDAADVRAAVRVGSYDAVRTAHQPGRGDPAEPAAVDALHVGAVVGDQQEVGRVAVVGDEDLGAAAGAPAISRVAAGAVRAGGRGAGLVADEVTELRRHVAREHVAPCAGDVARDEVRRGGLERDPAPVVADRGIPRGAVARLRRARLARGEGRRAVREPAAVDVDHAVGVVGARERLRGRERDEGAVAREVVALDVVGGAGACQDRRVGRDVADVDVLVRVGVGRVERSLGDPGHAAAVVRDRHVGAGARGRGAARAGGAAHEHHRTGHAVLAEHVRDVRVGVGGQRVGVGAESDVAPVLAHVELRRLAVHVAADAAGDGAGRQRQRARLEDLSRAGRIRGPRHREHSAAATIAIRVMGAR